MRRNCKILYANPSYSCFLHHKMYMSVYKQVVFDVYFSLLLKINHNTPLPSFRSDLTIQAQTDLAISFYQKIISRAWFYTFITKDSSTTSLTSFKRYKINIRENSLSVLKHETLFQILRLSDEKKNYKLLLILAAHKLYTLFVL